MPPYSNQIVVVSKHVRRKESLEKARKRHYGALQEEHADKTWITRGCIRHPSLQQVFTLPL